MGKRATGVRRSLIVAMCVSLCVLLVAPVSARTGSAELQIAAEPSLYPAFDPQVPDYVTRCDDRSVQLSVAAPHGIRVAVDGRRPETGTFLADVPLNIGDRFSISVLSRNGSKRNYHIRCLPSDFPAWVAQGSRRSHAQFYMVAPFAKTSFEPPPSGTSLDYVAIYDHNGVPVWWMKSPPTPIDTHMLEDGTLAWTHFPTETRPYEIRRLDGSLVRTVATAGTPTDLHDIQLLPNGNYVLGSYRVRSGVDLTSCGGTSNATVQDAEIQEVTPDGRLVWSWNSKDHISLAETTWCPTPDLVHWNSTEVDGQHLIISLRHTDAIYKISRKTGEIVWKLGGTQRPESLKVVGDFVFDSFGLGGAHDVRVLHDGTVTMHDNGGTNDNVTNPDPNRQPRAVRYSIDTASKTATLLEEITDPRAPVGPCCGRTHS